MQAGVQRDSAASSNKKYAQKKTKHKIQKLKKKERNSVCFQKHKPKNNENKKVKQEKNRRPKNNRHLKKNEAKPSSSSNENQHQQQQPKTLTNSKAHLLPKPKNQSQRTIPWIQRNKIRKIKDKINTGGKHNKERRNTMRKAISLFDALAWLIRRSSVAMKNEKINYKCK